MKWMLVLLIMASDGSGRQVADPRHFTLDTREKCEQAAKAFREGPKDKSKEVYIADAFCYPKGSDGINLTQ